MNQMNIRTTFNKNGDADSYEIKYNTYRLLAFEYNGSASSIEIWNRQNNCVARTILYKPIHKLTNTTLRNIMIASIAETYDFVKYDVIIGNPPFST
tara:strand:- start:113 stop:400 length:288 start_codon:yes stop_codon:yes gene_type:complete